MSEAENGIEQPKSAAGSDTPGVLKTGFAGGAQEPMDADAADANDKAAADATDAAVSAEMGGDAATETETENGAAEGSLENAAVSEARAERIEARDTVIGIAQADAMDLRDGLVGIAGAERIEASQSFIGLAGANELSIRESTVLFAGGQVEGENVQVMVTPKQAAMAGAAFAFVFALMRWIFATEKE